MELRKAGATYRAIARELGVDVHTAHADVAAELADLRVQTAHTAEDVRDLELARLDAATNGVWPDVQAGDPRAVMAIVRIGERRSKLLGLDAPQQSSVNVKADVATRDSKEYYRRLAVRLEDDELKELQQLQEAQRSLLDKAEARLKARSAAGWS